MLDPSECPAVPVLLPWAETPWRAWHDLHADRKHTVSGMAMPMGGTSIQSIPGAIPWTALMQWCDRAGLDEEERDGFVLPIVRALDREFLAHCERQRQRGAAPADDKLSRWGEADGDDTDRA